jgi:Major Facilitator Superfamily
MDKSSDDYVCTRRMSRTHVVLTQDLIVDHDYNINIPWILDWNSSFAKLSIIFHFSDPQWLSGHLLHLGRFSGNRVHIFHLSASYENHLAQITCRDIYRPTKRVTALGWFLSGIQIGPALGPCISGVIVTFMLWWVIFWLQTALSVISTLGTFIWVPETID